MIPSPSKAPSKFSGELFFTAPVFLVRPDAQGYTRRRGGLTPPTQVAMSSGQKLNIRQPFLSLEPRASKLRFH
jgi:hypothetical protein